MSHHASDATKRAIDVVVAAVALVLLSPLLAVLWVLIRLRMGSPVLFRQLRPGRHGRPFELVKFRTMTDGRDADGELLPDAERLTALGRWLRRTSLDELPELLNVLQGDMSLVGPRPLLMEYLPLYSPEQARRHEVRPGITGWAQVNGRNTVSWPDKFALRRVVRRPSLDPSRLRDPVAHRHPGGERSRRERRRPCHDGTLHRERAAKAGSVRVSRVLVIGGAGQGRQVIDAIVARAHHEVVGVLDRSFRRGDVVAGFPVLGSDLDLRAAALETAADGFVVAIGDNHTRGEILERESGAAAHLHPAIVVHPAATVARDAVLGAGTILLAGAVVGNGSRIGRGVLLGINSSVDHDGWVDDHASLAPNAATGGTVRIGRASAIGIGANVIHEVTIGADTVVGAGAVVLGDLPDRVVAYGVPARVVRSREPGEPYLQRH